ncbi:outer membrane transport energization protein TonB [Flavobacterium sp. 1]|uniref:energy transducer TonB n=1 Tax=Flavobacterium sp. 1 TaxID=2035200 RepID=UPI000C24DC80|nr:energy transducer TonB [Flavobacterium sp. 1]PJJ10736.1 outer membrane transport energization protein TonB [Flavobacterium sp. 1]
MKLDLIKNQWIEIVFEGRNKLYGAYVLRKSNRKTSMRALIIGSVLFSLAISAPLIASYLPKGGDDDTINEKIIAVKMPPKKKVEAPKDLAPPPPPPPKQDQVKFVKPVVTKAEDVTEDPPKMDDIKDKKTGAETIKGDPDAPLTVEEVGNGPVVEVIAEDTSVHSLAGIEQKPEFPGGIEKFYAFVGKNYTPPEEEGLKGKVYVTFVVEKDGTLTDIKVIRDIGYGTGKEAIRVLNKCPKWLPGEQNGKKVRVLYSLPITIQSAE